MRNVTLTYFKDSGKYYAEGILQVEDSAGWYDVIETVRATRQMRLRFPGLTGSWGGPILVDDGSVPHLVAD